MKKFTSVFGLIARSSIFKLLITFILLGALELFLFYRKLSAAIMSEWQHPNVTLSPLEGLVSDSGIPWLFALAFVAVTVFLCMTGTQYSSKSGYTLARLSITEKQVFFCQTLYNIIIYLVLWAYQIALFAIAAYLYTSLSPVEYIGEQSVFLAFYRNKFMHCILPLSEVLLWIRNVAIAVGLGFAAAEFPYNQRGGKFGITVIGYSLYTLIFFVRSMGNIWNCIVFIGISIVIAVKPALGYFEEEDDESN